jgi:outer membrane protein
MKLRILLFVIFTAFTSSQLVAQKFGYVDTDYILSQMTEFKAAQKQLDEASQKWELEIKSFQGEIDKMYKEYKSEEIMLSPSQREERENAIVKKEESLREFEQDKFGVNGQLFKKRQELIKPIQSKISEAILKVAKNNGLDFIFDKSANMNILYSNIKYDRSGDVLDELGVVPNKD